MPESTGRLTAVNVVRAIRPGPDVMRGVLDAGLDLPQVVRRRAQRIAPAANRIRTNLKLIWTHNWPEYEC